MQYRDKIHNYVQEHKSEIVNTLKELVKIPSVRGTAEEHAPFGRECARVLKYTQDLYSNNGFETELDEDGGYLLSYCGEGGKSIGLFAHADVVSVGDDWVFTNPFEPVEKDGCLIGRGVIDDKAAIVISLYCAKMIKELNLPFESRLIMYTGSNEETGMADIKNYIRKHTAPDFSFVCDTAFPLFRGCKSLLRFWVTPNKPLCDIKDFGGGKSINIVLGQASAQVNRETVTASGKSSHAALPEGSLNAGYVLAKKLAQREDICESDRNQMLFVAKILERYYGEIYGIEHTDPDFGRLTCTNGIIKTVGGKLSLSFDMRFGLSADKDKIKDKIVAFFKENDCTVTFADDDTGYITSPDNKYLKACIKAYSDFTGVADPDIYLNAGATYGRMLPCAVEIGTSFGGAGVSDMPSGHGGPHQSDECINIEGILKAAEITMCMLLETDKTGR